MTVSIEQVLNAIDEYLNIDDDTDALEKEASVYSNFLKRLNACDSDVATIIVKQDDPTTNVQEKKDGLGRYFRETSDGPEGVSNVPGVRNNNSEDNYKELNQ